MEMIRRLFSRLGRSWSDLPKEKGVLQIKKNTGPHIYASIEVDKLILHSVPYFPYMKVKQEIMLDGYTLNELSTLLNSMGYTSSILDVEKGSQKAYTLLTCNNMPLQASGSVFDVFTSVEYGFIYPFARVLHHAENDIEEAIRQLVSASSRGSWLDYWSSFFSVKRVTGETDEQLSARILSKLLNLKTNNRAIQELLTVALKAPVEVVDKVAGQFEVQIHPSNIPNNATVREIINDVKGAGYDYLVNYLSITFENYPAYFLSTYGRPIQNTDVMVMQIQQPTMTDTFGKREGTPLRCTMLSSRLNKRENTLVSSTTVLLKDELTFMG